MSSHCNATPYEHAGYDDFARYCDNPSAHLAAMTSNETKENEKR